MMEKEVDLFTNRISEEDDTVDVEADADNEDDDEGERCGLCMDMVVDRGLLDCCHHWFCFVCIDNWATITNLCPLCQLEFQLITCIPVFDTISTTRLDDDPHSRDDDWSVEDNNNMLSFPSYYIDENAVACLDGGGCNVRSGSVTPEQPSTLDTSIACDSCDIWYHATCVGFDPEGSEVDTWLCPRCLVNRAEHKSESKEMFNREDQLSLSIGDHHSLAHTCSGKVSISIADDGETALVISRVDGEDVAKEPIANCISTQEVMNCGGNNQSTWSSDPRSSKLNEPLDQGITAIQPQPQPTIVPVKLEEYDVDGGPKEEESSTYLDLKLSVPVTSANKSLFHASDGKPSVTENLADRKTNLAPKTVKKRKNAENSVPVNHEDGHHGVELVNGSSTRKSKARKGIRRTLNDQKDGHTSETVDQRDKCLEDSVDDKRGSKKSSSVDIMSIVKRTESRFPNGAMNQKVMGKDARVQKNAARLRVKKIMRRPGDNTESAEVVQKLKTEIREAVRKKSLDTGKSIVDPNLLAAFRAAVAEPAQKVPPVNVKAKKFMLQKGKAREHLTKKIYAMSNGKRRRAWDRECEVEFWKHRCSQTSKPEKIATLKSVLNLLQRKPETRNADQNSKEEDKAPILSRLYLADASVFPRKDDIKPLSVLKASTSSHNSGMLSSSEKDIKPCLDNCSVNFPNTNEIHAESDTTTADDKNKKGSTSLNNGVTVRKLNTGGQAEKCSSLNKITGKTEGLPMDKRKWALEILARKTASNNTSPNQKKQDDELLKGSYPLLGELPSDLRPKLASIRHNKIPFSVRQAQLYRLTELFLKKANLPSICRTVATELAVADAVNIEKQVAERSISKVVYLNLCSQEIQRNSNSSAAECTPSSPSPVPTEVEQPSSASLASETEAALRAAGLLSDSPPSSPCQKAEDLDYCDSPAAKVKEGETQNVLEIDSQPDVDIYGDFEYDLDEEDYIGATAIASSQPHAEEGDSKVKVVFSTLTLGKSENGSEGKVQDLVSSSRLLGCLNDAESESSLLEGKKGSTAIPGDTLIDGEGDELSLVECEQLYGPEKEPIVRECSVVISTENSTSQSAINLDNGNPDKSHHSVVVGGQSPNSSRVVENTQEEKTSDLKVERKSQSDYVLKKVEAYIKEHIRPLCKSGVITVDQYRWAVGKTTDKVMKYHTKAKNANFLIKDGDKVKKLAQQYIEAAAKHKETM